MAPLSELSLKYNITLVLLNPQLRSYWAALQNVHMPHSSSHLPFYLLPPMIPFALWVEHVANSWDFIQKCWFVTMVPSHYMLCFKFCVYLPSLWS